VPIPDIERPIPRLLLYYALKAVAALPMVVFMGPYLYFRYHTMRYHFDEKGISTSWGIFFRHEIYLTYARIQDIHLVSNLVERWLGLARIQIQTASGSSGAEMTLEGIPDHEAMRDFLYSRIRGDENLKPEEALSREFMGLAEDLKALRNQLLRADHD